MAWLQNGNSEGDRQGDGSITTEERRRAGREVGAVQNLEYRLSSDEPNLTAVAGATTAAWLCEVLAWYGYHHMKAKELAKEDRGCIVP